MTAGPTLVDAGRSVLLVVDVQARLVPAIAEGEAVTAAVRRLVAGARLLGVPRLFTEHNPAALGPTLAPLGAVPDEIFPKMTFSACGEPGFPGRLPAGAAIVVAGCETHVCVQQTVMELLGTGRRVLVAADAAGSRHAGDKAAALARMERHGAEIVTAETMLFEWLRDARDPRLRQILALVKGG